MSQAPPTQTLALTRDDAPEVRAAPRVALRSGVNVSRFYATYAMGAGFPAVTGLLLYGWRALAMLVVVLATTYAAFFVWRRIGARGRQLHLGHSLWLAMLLWLILPAHLFGGPVSPARYELWPIPIAAAGALVILTWLLGGVGAGRIHPVLVTYLLLVAAFDQMMVPGAVLQRHRSFSGDLAKAAPPAAPAHAYMKDGYLKTPHVDDADALQLEPAATRLLAFTSGQRRPGRSWLSLESLLRDEVPPLEDLIIGGQPGPIGATCAVAVIIGGLFLLYRGIIDFRVPLCIFVAAFAAFVILPIPIIIKESPDLDTGGGGGGGGTGTRGAVVASQGGPEWRWFIFREQYREPKIVDVGWAEAVTFANYEFMAGPMLLMMFFFATAPALRPMAGRARVLYGLLVGVLAAGLQLYVSISYGPYLALLLVSLLTPLLDRVTRQRPLV